MSATVSSKVGRLGWTSCPARRAESEAYSGAAEGDAAGAGASAETAAAAMVALFAALRLSLSWTSASCLPSSFSRYRVRVGVIFRGRDGAGSVEESTSLPLLLLLASFAAGEDEAVELAGVDEAEW